MTLDERLQSPESPWTHGDGPENDVVLSSRVRLARNFKQYPFPTRQNRESALQVWRILSDYCEKNKGYQFYDLSRATARERQVLVEKHLISPEHAQNDEHYRALVLSKDSNESLMINEEDHLRLQVFGAGLSLDTLWARANELDDAIEHEAAYAFNERLGYLTSCPTNLGTGLRASVLVHVPALRMTKRLGILQRFTQMGMAVRGLFGEGSESAGDFYQISNQQTLGKSEADIIQNLEAAARRIIVEERNAREQLRDRMGDALSDKVWRTFGMLSFVRQLSSAEAYDQLSLLRMGAAMGLLTGVQLKDIDALYVQSQAGYLMLSAGEDLDEHKRDTRRAAQFRKHLSQLGTPS